MENFEVIGKISQEQRENVNEIMYKVQEASRYQSKMAYINSKNIKI